MNAAARRPFWLALAFSLMLHLAALTAPGWGLLAGDEAVTHLPLTATLLMPPPAHPAPAAPLAPSAKAQRAKPAPAAPPAPMAPPVQNAPAVPVVSEAPQELQPPVPPAAMPADAPADAAPPTAAVPPAPTFVPPFAATWPQRGRIRFTVTRGENGFIVGQAEHNWQHDGATYLLRAVTETIGLAAVFKPATVLQESRGIFVAAGLQPLEFKSERDGKLKVSLRFDPAQKRIFSSSGSSDELSEQTQDMLSLFYQLGALPPAATEFFLRVATGRKLERYVLTPGATLMLDTPFGERAVQHYVLPGTRGGESDDSTEIWLDSQTRLPLKIRHRDRKGEVFDQTATAVELDPTE